MYRATSEMSRHVNAMETLFHMCRSASLQLQGDLGTDLSSKDRLLPGHVFLLRMTTATSDRERASLPKYAGCGFANIHSIALSSPLNSRP